MPSIFYREVEVMKELTPKQKAFVANYLIDLNATQAAIRAGYSPKTAYSQGQANLKKPEIKNAIEKTMNEKNDETIAKQDEVLRYLTSVLRGEIKEECIVIEGEGDGCSSARIKNKQVSPKDRNKAAELLAKRYGLLTDNMNMNTTIVQIVDDIDG